MNDINVPRRPTPVPTAFDTWAVLDFWLRRWPWLAVWTVVLAIVGGVAAYSVWKTEYTSTAQLMRYTPSAIDDAYHPKDIATPSLVLMLQSPRFMEEVGATMKPPLAAGELAARISIVLDRNGDVVTIRGTGPEKEATVDLVNQFTNAAVAYTQKLQGDEAVESLKSVNQQLAAVAADNVRIVKEASPAAVEAGQTAAQMDEPTVTAAVTNLPQRLQAAQTRLDELQDTFKDDFPAVQQQKARVQELSDQLKAYNATAPRARAPLSAVLPSSIYNRLTPQDTAVSEQLRNNYNTHSTQSTRRNAIAPFAENPPGYLHIFEPASPSRATQDNHKLQIVVWTCLAGLLGFFAAAGQVLLSEFTDNRVKTRADVRRVTGLPVLATLGDLNRLTPAGRDQWAFRAWTALQSRLSLSPNHGMICGITSARPGEGRSTWVELLSRAASNCGFRVLTVTAQPTAEMAAEMTRSAKANGHHYNGFKRAKDEKISKTDSVNASTARPSDRPTGTTDEGVALTTSVLSSPGQIVERLAAADGPPVVNIPLPGWVWNLDRRKQWQAALEAWRAIENVVIFVELPPAAVPETVLLAENIPNLLWLSDSQSSDASETHIELETLRDARCNLVGAVLNREPVTPIRGRFSRWFGSSAFLLAFGLLFPTAPEARAADGGTASVPSTSFSVTTPAQRASWQQKLTLGPGDVLTFHLFGEPALTREEVPIAPDGRVSYLEASNLMASGLTVDELRTRLNEELGRYRRAPQAFIEPVAYNSKRYSVLGAVGQKGTFPLNRPITVLEAVALARGFETGVSKGTLTESANFSQAFLSRGGRKMAIDFEKLFLHGDLSQNVALEPNDYLYFPPSGGGEIYVLGEVRQPGSLPFDTGASVISAVTGRGGFTDHAWKSHVLVVRGSLTNPEAIRVDVAEALAGKTANFALKPGDFIYVNNRPWSRAVDLLDRAASAFVEAAVVGWTTSHVGPSGVTSTPVIIP